MAQRWELKLLFGEGGASGGADGAGEAAEAAQEQQEQQPADKAAAFRELIKGEYKAEFDQVMKDNLARRFKQQDSMQKQLDAYSPIMQLLGSKYGVDASDTEALIKAAEADESYYENEAAEKGLTVQQLKEIKRMERENQQLRHAAEEAQRRDAAQQVQARWMAEAEQVKAIYPTFDFEAEAQNPHFAKLLQNGIDVRTAFEVAHHDEIIGGVMQFAAKTATEQTVNNIRARGMRPAEGAMGNAAPAANHTDVSKLTREERNDLARRALRGERITFEGS